MAENGEVERLRQSLAQQEKENARLRRVISLMAAPLDDDSEDSQQGMAVDAAALPEDDGSAVADSDTEDSEIPVAVWDPADRVYRCVDCWGEVDELVCFSCRLEHVLPEDESDEYDSIAISQSRAFLNDRVIAPRGSTPLLELDKHGLALPWQYSARNPKTWTEYGMEVDRRDEYEELRLRGATREMCEEFYLEFTRAKGIVAWMNQDLMDEFAGPAMKKGDKWKIYLGRCVELDEDDHDGTLFIEGILEDGLLFSGNYGTPEWVTIEEADTTWATMPNPELKDAPQYARDMEEDSGAEDGEPEEGAEAEDEDTKESGEEVEAVPSPLQNKYDSESEEELDSEVNHENEDDGAERPTTLQTTEIVGISLADIGDSDGDWEMESTDASSCDSESYSSSD